MIAKSRHSYASEWRVQWKDPGKNPLVNHIGERLNSDWNQNWLAVYTGPTGSGKSYGALRTCELYYKAYKDKGFTQYVDDYVAFSAKEFMEMVQDGHFQKGDILIWDEAGVGINSRQWYSLSNKAVLYVLQTFRHLNLGVIFTTPTFGYIDSAVRPLFHTLLIFKPVRVKVNYGGYVKRVTVADTRRVVTDPYTGKMWFPRYMFKVGGKYVYWAYTYFQKPNRRLVKKYESKKQKFSTELRKEMREALDDISKAKTKMEPKDIVNAILANADKYFFVNDKGKLVTDVGRIMMDFKINQNDARVIAKTVLRMGVGEDNKLFQMKYKS